MIIDLTMPVPGRENNHPAVSADPLHISGPGFDYTGIVYHFNHWSMSGTYIDFPGHIKELDDGATAENYPLEKLYEVETAVIHLGRAHHPGKISAEELAEAAPDTADCGALIVHALGHKRHDEVPERSVALSRDACEWIVAQGVHLLVSDVYEHAGEPENVFWHLFSAGVSTVCAPVNLHLLDEPRVKLTVLFPRFQNVTQLACRVVARMQ
ncbi:MAG: cyclase family protein [Armatimonadota bacterium]